MAKCKALTGSAVKGLMTPNNVQVKVSSLLAHTATCHTLMSAIYLHCGTQIIIERHISDTHIMHWEIYYVHLSLIHI